MNNFKDKLKVWATEARYFLTSKIFLKNFAGMLGLIAGATILIMLFIRFYTRHDTYITVPSVVGKTVEQAKALKESRFVELYVVDSVSRFDDSKKPGEILFQDPPANSKAKKYRKVYLTIKARENKEARFPWVWDKQANIARGQLRRANFIIEREETKPDKAAGTVLEVRLAENNKIIKRYDDKDDVYMFKEGTKVILVVAEGSGPAVEVPSFVCMTYDQAVSTIQSLEFSTGSVIFSGNISDTASAVVWRQSPAFADEATINKGDPIDLWLQAETPYGCADLDDDLDDNFEDEY